MKTNDIIEKAFSLLEDANQVEGFNPDGFRTFTIEKEAEDFRFHVFGRVDNTYQGRDIRSRYIDMSYTIRIANYPTNGELNGAFGGKIQERTEIYQN